MCRAVGDPKVPEGRRCDGKCSDPVYKAAYGRARTEAINAGMKTTEIPEYLDVSIPAQWDIEVLELANRVGDALRYESEERDELLAVYGTEEQAVNALGARIASRAEEIAGITGEDVRRRWNERFDEICEAEEELPAEAAKAEVDEVSNAFNAIYSGQDSRSLEDLGRLAKGYRAALAEVHSMGGHMSFNPMGDDSARLIFTDASDVYPSDWLEKSNDFGKAPAVFETSGQYASYRPHGDVPIPGRTPTPVEFVGQYGPREMSPSKEISYEPMAGNPPGEGDPEAGKAWYREIYWDVHDGVRGRPDSDPAVNPAGEGWELYEPGNLWRRPQMDTPSVTLPTLTFMDHDPTGVAGKPRGYASAVHELAHRFEHTMVEILRLESAFVTRRTTAANGEREELSVWNPKIPEVKVRKDHFVATYIGREYPKTKDERSTSSAVSTVLGNAEHFGTGYEVLSMGTEALFGGNYGGFVGLGKNRADDDHRNFVLGTLAAVGRPW